eukprot:14265105-Alexandrium_andersonii.AAC.1
MASRGGAPPRSGGAEPGGDAMPTGLPAEASALLPPTPQAALPLAAVGGPARALGGAVTGPAAAASPTWPIPPGKGAPVPTGVAVAS